MTLSGRPPQREFRRQIFVAAGALPSTTAQHRCHQLVANVADERSDAPIYLAPKSHQYCGITESGRRVGETHHLAKLTDADVDLVFELRRAGLSYEQIASKFDDVPGGIAKSTIRDILKGRIRVARACRLKRIG